MRTTATVVMSAGTCCLPGAEAGGSSVESLDDLGAMLEEQEIDCSDLRDDSGEMLVREGGSCEGGDIPVYVFNDSENRDNYLDIAFERRRPVRCRGELDRRDA